MGLSVVVGATRSWTLRFPDNVGSGALFERFHFQDQFFRMVGNYDVLLAWDGGAPADLSRRPLGLAFWLTSDRASIQRAAEGYPLLGGLSARFLTTKNQGLVQ
jgi:hypothetical protein